MKTVEFLAHLRSLDIQISVDEDKLRCNAPEGVLTSALQSEIRDRKAELITFLHHAKVTLQPPEFHRSSNRTSAPLLSFAQQRLWFLEQLAPGNAFYNVPTAMRLTGALNCVALEQSFNEIVRRHETLRTSFRMQEGHAVQVIAPDITLSLPVTDLRSLSSKEQSAQVQTLAIAESQKPFDLAQAPLLRVKLLQLDQAEFVLLLTLHHIISDGWSIGVLVRELGSLYSAFAHGQPSPLTDLPLQYADFADWQRNWLRGDVLETQLTYWRQQLENLPTLELPTDRPRPAIQQYRGATRSLKLSADLSHALETLSQHSGVTLFITLLAAFQTLLYRYTGQTDLAIGSPIANRNRSEIEGLIGFFVNSLVMRTDLSGNPTFAELLERSRQVALDAYAHQDLPFERLVEELQPDRDLSRNPLFQVVLALQNAPGEALELPGVTLNPIEFDPGTTRFDLEFHVSHSTHLGDLTGSTTGLTVLAVYNTDLFDAATIAQMLQSFQTLLTSITANPNQSISTLTILTANEYQHLVKWNRTQIPYATDQCIHQLFESQVERTPDAIAVASVTAQLTYRELNDRSNQLAHYLRSHNITAETPVGICVDRSPDLLIGLLGILKAGGAYLPIDPAYPSERLAFMLNDAEVPILLTQQHLIERFSNICEANRVICLDRSDTFASYSQENLDTCVTANNLAYILYTSGSTGQPKGVLVEHRSLLNLIFWHHHAFEISASDRATQVAGIAFDACGWELFPYLTVGASIHIPDQITRTSPTLLQAWIIEQQITISFLPTPLAEKIFDLNWSKSALRFLLTGGDKLRRSPAALPLTVVNNYGLTETTVVATSARIRGNTLTIGDAIANTQLYVLDIHLQPVPLGAKGELCIGGDGLARGYLNRLELTAERFIDNPFNPGSRLYKTGDEVRYRANGQLEFLGRLDEQVNLRGYRIELGEIEAALTQHPAVQTAIAIADEHEGDPRLIAYVTQRPDPLDANQTTELQAEQVLQWQMLYEETYGQPAPVDPTFNITGWNSSYTGQPLPAEQIQEWVDRRVEYVLSLQPQRVLEIGCGTGLMLFRLAPHCMQYWGTDFSEVGLHSIQQQLSDGTLPQVELLQKVATDFDEIPPNFDAVILNSVVQYFPSVEYLMQVIEGAIRILHTPENASTPAGFIFLGDIRSLPLLKAFHTSVQLYQAESSLDKAQLGQRVQTQVLRESELVIDPAFFSALCDRFPEITHVQIDLTEGHHHNEMTQFRYNVTLHIGTEITTPTNSSTWLDWSSDRLNLSNIKQLLHEQPNSLGITQVPNARVSHAMRAVQWLESAETPETVGEFRELQCASGIDPEALRSLIKELPYTIRLCESASSAGYYDVLFVHNSNKTTPEYPLAKQSKFHSWQSYANNPLQAKLAAHLVPQLRSHLSKKLPDYMIPAQFIVLESFPLTPNGKIDRRALPKPDRTRFESIKAYAPPRSEVEQRLTEIWCTVLSLKQVGVYDNFFELGGHSLLATQLVSRIRDTFDVELPLRSLFETPTIDGLANEIERLQNSAVKSKIPAIVPLSRETYRVKLSSLQNDPK